MAEIMRTSKRKLTVSKAGERSWPLNKKVQIIKPIIKPTDKR